MSRARFLFWSLALALAGASAPMRGETSPAMGPAKKTPTQDRVAKKHAKSDEYPQKDLAVYRLALRVKDERVRDATIDALTHYEERFDLLVEHILKEAKTGNPDGAIRALAAFSRRDGFERQTVSKRYDDWYRPRRESTR